MSAKTLDNVGARVAYSNGTDAYYETHGDTYYNPHESSVQTLVQTIVQQLVSIHDQEEFAVLDLCAGSGQVSLAVMDLFNSLGDDARLHLDAMDPYTCAAYERRVHRPCEAVSFKDIAAGLLCDRKYSVVICSFALHLANPSLLYAVCTQLSMISQFLVIVTPHKRPLIPQRYGWVHYYEQTHHRVRARVYMSLNK